MAKIRRGNVVLHVAEDEVDYYIKLGYEQIAPDGSVIKKGVPSDVGELQVAYVSFQKRIAELEAELAELKSEKKPTAKTKKQ